MTPDRTPAEPHDDRHDRGLQYDLLTMSGAFGLPGVAPTRDRRIGRRRALTLLGGGLAATTLLAVCGSKGSDQAASTSTSTTSTGGVSTSTGAAAAVVPEETAGPFPGDGSNGPNLLTTDGVVRKDIRSSIGSASGTAEGVPLTIRLRVADASDGGTPTSGAAVYVWHCSREGQYSMYDIADQNYLRGVQETDQDGWVEFTSIFPACYSGRWPHIHFEVYPSLAKATSAAGKLATSQIALPSETCATVYDTAEYSSSKATFAQTSLTTDMVFSDDGAVHQLATMSGDVSRGYTATLEVTVA